MALLITLKKETIKYHLLFFLIVGLNSGWLTSVMSWVALSTQKENKFQSTKTMAKHTQYTKPRCFDLLYFALFNSSLTKSNNSASSVGGAGDWTWVLVLIFLSADPSLIPGPVACVWVHWWVQQDHSGQSEQCLKAHGKADGSGSTNQLQTGGLRKMAGHL